jgi:hypothetical protein
MEGSYHGQRCYIGIYLERLRETTETSVRTAGLKAEI